MSVSASTNEDLMAALLDFRDAVALALGRVDARFESQDKRFDQLQYSMNKRFDSVDARFDRLETRLTDIEVRRKRKR